jgi:hypothetical protein
MRCLFNFNIIDAFANPPPSDSKRPVTKIRLLLIEIRLLVADELGELHNELVEVLVKDFKRTTHLFRGM